MSTYHFGVLAYGIDLGTSDEHFIEERGEWGSLDLPWMRRDEDGFTTENLTEAFTRRLYEAVPGVDGTKTESYQQEDDVWEHYGVKILEHGWLHEGDTVSFALIAYSLEVDGGDALPLDLPGLIEMQKRLSFDEKLAGALKVLGVTPTKSAAWLLMGTR